MISALSWEHLALLYLAAFGIGFAKSGFSAVSMVHVIVFSTVFEPKSATGILLPLLIVGDVLAVIYFGTHANWVYLWRMMGPAVVGVVIGTYLMDVLPPAAFSPIVGTIVLLLTAIQVTRLLRPNFLEHVPHATWFVWSLGILAGIATMIANAAGPIIAIYLVAISLPKFEFVGTSAWFFLILNVFKVPFSAGLGLISLESLQLNALLAPMVFVGLLAGRWAVHRIAQKWFDILLLSATAIAALRLIGLF